MPAHGLKRENGDAREHQAESCVHGHEVASRMGPYPFMILRMPSAISLMPSSGVTAFVVIFPKTGWMTFADI